MNEEKILNIYNNIKGLVQYKNKSEKEIMEVARKKVKGGTLEVTTQFKGKEERKLAKELATKYLSDYSIETISDKNSLTQLIYLEVVQHRIQDQLNVFYEKEAKAIPNQLVSLLHENSEAIIKLKNTLGLNRSKGDKKTPYDVVSHLKKRFKKWREENQGSRTIVCPHCVKMVLLKIRTEAWESQKHPFFRDKILYNEHLLKLYKTKVITKKDVSLVLEVSEDYVDWVIEKIEKPLRTKEEKNANIEQSSSVPK